PRGSRVRMVVSELRGEKIDIIPYNEEPARFVAKALSPARVREVLVDDDSQQATVIVPDDQLSLAIGREGQNARLAARLTGWRVDIKSETEFSQESSDGSYDEEQVAGRCAAILANGRRCPNSALPGSRYCGLDAHQALANQDTDYVGGPPADNGDLPDEADISAEPAPVDDVTAPAEADGETPVASGEVVLDDPEEDTAIAADPVAAGLVDDDGADAPSPEVEKVEVPASPDEPAAAEEGEPRT
ncbi:MAG TPA: hypothetical protein VFR49_10700, partial [Solirubrobacteraceae bacterium]|nr:hypothetical protein [Solirubrobacteraceae bacterium]